jgi:pimeloyl-ACP methyl ester carboxylesterase
MADLVFTRTGRGEPLLLVHGIGGSNAAWQPVIPILAERFDVIAVDLPGFGDSPPLPAGIEPTPAALAAAVADFLDRLGVGPAHIAGNSLGGWVVLELAKLRAVRTVALLSPAGLWRRGAPLYCRISLGATRWFARRATRLLLWAVGSAAGRTLVMSQTHGRPWAIGADYARTAVRALAGGPGFEATMRATFTRRFRDGAGITAPMTVAFGGRDRILLRRQSRHLDQLPATVRTAALPRCGHVPMADDPPTVAAVIAQATAVEASPDGP